MLACAATSSRRITQAERCLAILERAANAGDICPTNETLADLLGYSSGNGPSGLVNLLEVSGLITVARSNAGRVITIVRTGKQTAGIAIVARHGLDRRSGRDFNGRPRGRRRLHRTWPHPRQKQIRLHQPLQKDHRPDGIAGGMKRHTPAMCDCTTCQQLDHAHPREGRQIAMFASATARKSRAAKSKSTI
ncbi:hypothetical protein [Sphingobium yanoikuyae]|uniref:hypothetical protein n=1 Tax=Sphingobium yanoikuyae TaxID=13690 RepID=UPI00243275AB|nr:hypothetical protein [Sphingobium yanoikuyae]